MVLGARLNELKLGFLGIDPSVTLPEWFTGPRQAIVHYAGGLAVGTIFLVFYCVYWLRKYRRSPGSFV
ncbi:MAG: hypothetical protein DRI39_10420 [Chloroflexi bacterium]|nr:MAG: hypothetical protein DRI39_10420 [Chloroflexota bacterium]